MNRSLPLFALLLVGCAAPVAETVSVAPAPVAPPAPKSVEAIPPTNIGDGSAIAFTHWKGVRKGKGTLTESGNKMPVESFDLELNPDSTMKLIFSGQAEATLSGTWRRKDGKTVELTIKDLATGTLLFMDRANPYQLSLKGKQVSADFRVSE